MWFSLFRLICLLCLFTAGQAAPLSLAQQPGPAAIRAQARYYAGPLPADSLATVRQPGARFLPLAERKPDLRADGHWLRLDLVNDTGAAGRWLLDLGLPDIQRLTVYQVSGQRVATLLALQPDSPFAARPIPRRLLAVPLDLAAGEQAELYLHYRIHGDTPLQLQLRSPAGFDAALAAGNLRNGLLLGILLSLLAFALLQYRALHRPAYRHYAIMLVFVMLFQLQIEGYNFALVWPELGRWNLYAPVIMVAMIHLSHALFTISLFQLRRTLGWLYRCYMVFAAVTLAGLAVFLATEVLWPLLVVFLLFTPLPVLSGILAWRRRLPAAGYYLAGASSLAVFMNLLFSLSVAGVGNLADIDLFVYPKLGYLCEAILFALALGRQITLLHQRHEANLQHRLIEAEQLARAEADKHRALLAAQQGQLQLAAAGHDLSQPLASIRFALAALHAQAGNEATTRHIDKALDYTEALLRGLVSEAKAGFEGSQQTIALSELLAEIAERHQPEACRKGLYLRYFASSGTIAGSSLVLNRILDNLVGNAVRYTERGDILLGVRRRPGGIEIQVLDTGPGFDPSLQQRLLAPFEQTGQQPAERLGYGLGLHIVQALCEQSGYRLIIRSHKGRGSVFGVWLPVG